MYFVVILTQSKKKLVIPARYVYELDLPYALSFGVNKKVNHLVFYSQNEQDHPFFNAEIKETFNELESGCYFARIIRCFGKNLYVFIIHSKQKFVFK